ncbi:MAG: recombinase family protein [Acetatifactor muris]|nr:recombinase family protein [Acetatifactor muris]
MAGYLASYVRLSLEDDGDKDESNSIVNQRKLIQDYISHDPELRGYEAKEFCDDGYSGASMDRPGMQRLLAEIKGNQIRCIIVKDMSRFSRDYIEMGTYLDQIFPFMGIRFIALNDHYDSREHHGSTIGLDTAFQTLLYDLYSKDLSVKVKASFESKWEAGEYTFGQTPFGYRKSSEKKNAVLVDEEEAKIVRRIFSLAKQGMGSTQIARQLQSENIPTIMQMRKPHIAPKDGKRHVWSSGAVRKILNNRFYLGEMAYGKSVVASVGSKKCNAIPKKDWKVIPNHHEALVTPEEFEQVSLFGAEGSTKRKREKHPLTGKLYCGGCRYAMIYKPLRGKNRRRRFECHKHSLLGNPDCCTSFNAAVLEETVLFLLNKELAQRGDAMKQRDNLAAFQTEVSGDLKKRIASYGAEKREVQKLKDLLYEGYASGELSKEAYREKADELTGRIADLSAKESEAARELQRLEEEYQKSEEDMKQIIRYSHLEELTQEAVDVFIKKIYVYKDKRVEIEWNFCSGYEENGAKTT